MKKIFHATLFLTLLLMSIGRISAQVSTYNVTQIPYNPDPFTQGTPLLMNIDDIYSTPIALPFPICFFDSTFDSLVIGTNGIVSFDLSNANGFCQWSITNPIPSANYSNYTILGPMQDIDPSQGGTIRTAVAGTAPFRRFIVSYYQVPMFSCTNNLFSEQIILYETTNIIEMHILDKPLCTAWNNGAAILGIQYDSSLAYAAPGRNYPSQWVAMQEGWRFMPGGTCGGPGSVFNIISGKSYGDFNNNCVFDPGTDLPIANRPIHINNGAYYGWTDSLGDYAIAVGPGNWTIGQQILGPYFASGCPTSGTYNAVFTGTGQNFTADFADSVTVFCPDLWVDIGVNNLPRCANQFVNVNYSNLGTITDSAVVVVISLPDSISLLNASIPYTSLPNNTYSFAVGTLVPWQSGNFNMNVSVGCDTLGTVYCMQGDIYGMVSPECDTGNAISECHVLIGSFDPNDKRVAAQNTQMGYVTNDDIGPTDDLSYMVRFQNTGTDTAREVIILDTISPLLDIETVVVGSASHPLQWTRSGNVIRIEFPGILLPDSGANFNGSMGFVKIHADQLPGHQPGTVIENSAAIYFDNNAPIITNTTVNTIPLLIATENPHPTQLQLYPNPGRDQMTVVWEAEEGDQWLMFNLQGQVVLRQALKGRQTVVHTSELPAGMYLYQVHRQGQGILSGKWFKL